MTEPVAIVVPQLNPNDDYAVLVCWHIKSGTWVEAKQALATVETTKATYDVDTPRAGYAFFEQAPNTLVGVGTTIAWISEYREPPANRSEPASSGTGSTPDSSASAPRFSRKALKIMKIHGLTDADFPATGRVSVADVEKRAAERVAAPPVASAEIAPLEQSSTKMLEIARLTAIYKHAIPSTVVIALPCAEVQARLRRLAERFGPLSLLEVTIRDAAGTLAEFPEFNGFYADGRASRYTATGIGVAMNLGKSLRVPVVRDAGGLSYAEVARAVRDLSLRYLRGELTAADVANGTFTITDLSTHGVVHFVPVLNLRQAAILGICAPRPGSGQQDLVLTFDHRMSDGMQAAAFLSKLRARLTSDSID
jgi:pyruvate/2-oxoglutarate dehydrogenase complex dihydrolipoamide acyltransferase (E2) component